MSDNSRPSPPDPDQVEGEAPPAAAGGSEERPAPAVRAAPPDAAAWQVVEAELDVLFELPPAARVARLAALAVEQPALAAEVQSLLAADADASRFLSRPVGAVAPSLVAAVDQSGMPGAWQPTIVLGDSAGPKGDSRVLANGTLIGAWRLVSPLGTGGMGEVWRAERADGTYEQRVALKLLKRGLDSDGVLARFARERQILARLDHPGIARLLDGGATADGRPYLVTELVDGEPITVFASRRSLSIAERIRLVVACCEAVEAAHRRLVVHRDLKPSNILVDRDGRPRLLDFGIAKLLDDELPGGVPATAEGLMNDGVTALTQLDERVLTPAYAAPEQILGEPVTTATDVYALGVVLFELLTGQRPHTRGAGSLAGLAGEIAHESAPKPSSMVLSAKDPTGAFRLDGEPLVVGAPTELDPEQRRELERAARRLARELAGDLDTVVLRALHREPARRYPGAAALAADLTAFLEGKPVAARPDSLGYRSAKFARRHWVALTAGALVLLSLLGGLATTVWQAQRAERQAQRAERVKNFMVSLFEAADPGLTRGRIPDAVELVRVGAERVATELAAEPEVQAELEAALAAVQFRLGEHAAARDLATQAIRRFEALGGTDDPRLLTPLGSLVESETWLGNVDVARQAAERAIELARRSKGRDSLETVRAEANLAYLFDRAGNYDEAAALFAHQLSVHRRVFGDEGLETAKAMGELAMAYDGLDRMPEAIALYRGAVEIFEAKLPPDHPQLAVAYHNLASGLGWNGQLEESEVYYRRAIELRRRVLGPDHPFLAFSLKNFALVLDRQGRVDESDEVTREALAIFLAEDPKHPDAIGCRNSLALSEVRRGRFPQAVALLRQVAADWTELYGPDHPSTLQGTTNLGMALAEVGELVESERVQREALARREALFGPETRPVANSLSHLGTVLRYQGRVDEALETHQRMRRVAMTAVGPEHEQVASADLGLGLDLLAHPDPVRQLEAAAPLASALAIWTRGNPGAAQLADVVVAQARVDLAAGRLGDAERRLREALAKNIADRGDTHFRTAETRLYLGIAVAGQGKVEEGRSLLEAAAEALAATRGEGHDSTRLARKVLTALATARDGVAAPLPPRL